MASSNVYAAAHFALELDGKPDLGLFRSLEGGGVRAEVMTYAFGASKETGYGRWKILGKPKFEDFKLQVGMAMSRPFYEWIRDFFDGKPTRKNGAIIAADFHYKERARRTFKEAMIKELTIPKLDGSDKNPVYMTVAIAVEDITFEKGTGSTLDVAKGFDAQKLWTACNFELVIDQMPDACKRVTRIEPFTIKQNIIEYHRGGFKAPIKTPSPIEFPNLTFWIPEIDAGPFMEHSMKRVGYGGKGNGQLRDAATMNGHLDALDNEMNTIFTVEFFGADVISVTSEKQDAQSEELKLAKVELFTERMAFKYPTTTQIV
jgi:hypothetical protein